MTAEDALLLKRVRAGIEAARAVLARHPDDALVTEALRLFESVEARLLKNVEEPPP